MSCDCDKENCNCHETENTTKSVLSEDQKELLSRIEYSVGYAMNINFTNYFKRQLMKDVVENCLISNDPIWTRSEEKKKKLKTKLLENLDKIATADSGYDALKAYIDVMFSLDI